MIDLTAPLRMAMDDFGEDVVIGETPTRALISSISDGQQVGLVDDHNITAEVLAEDFVSISRNNKLTRADGSVWIVTNRPRVEYGGWRLELSRDMVSL